MNLGGHHRGSPPGGYYSPYQNPKLDDGPEGEYLPDRLTDEAIRFMQSKSEQPFLLYLSYYTVHTPIQASKRHLSEWEERAREVPAQKANVRPEGKGSTKLQQNRADYASMVAAMDENVGRLLDALEKQGLADNTLVIFTSDNGGLSTLPRIPMRQAPTSNEPLRAGKGWCYEGGIRVPLIIRAGKTNAVSKRTDPVISMDLLPSILASLNMPLPDSVQLDGQNILNGPVEARPLYWHFPHYHGSAWKPGSAMRLGPWKYIRFLTTGKEELYQVSLDPSERNNLAAQKEALLIQMRQMMDQWYQETQAKMPQPIPNDD
ncbi:MAG: sulfatase-like hydrolase/transferase [Bacteroidota bacterium]